MKRKSDFYNLMDWIDDLFDFVSGVSRSEKTLSEIIKIENFSLFEWNCEKLLAKCYLKQAWFKRGRALEAYLETGFTETKTYFVLWSSDAWIVDGARSYETFGIRMRRKTIECKWRRILIIHIDTKRLILKKAGE